MIDWSQPHASGSEHHVWFHQGKVWKLAYAPKTVEMGEDDRLRLAPDTSLACYLSRLSWTNRLFPEGALDFVGTTRNGTPVVTQTPVIGSPVDLRQIQGRMRHLGFVGAGPHVKAWAKPSDGLIVADCHEKNFVFTNNQILPIDVVVRYDPVLVSKLNLRSLPDDGNDDAL